METLTCKYCSSIRKNLNSLSQHQIRCSKNPDRRLSGFGNPNVKIPGGNQYTKARKLGLKDPKISSETRNKISLAAKNRTVPKETRNKISQKLRLAHKEGRAWNIGMSRWNNKPSYPEKFMMRVIENEFEDKNYTREFAIGIYSADFCWVAKKKVIEIDGEQHTRFQECIDRDLRKDIFLKSKGYEILRVSWKDICNSTQEQIQMMRKFIESSNS